MIFEATIDTRGTVAMLEGIASRSGDLRPAFKSIRELLIAGHKKNFEQEGAMFGDPWPSLSQETLARKARQGLPSTPLVATGALQRALGGGRGKRTGVTRTLVRVGVAQFYSRFHQAGAPGGRRGRMPRRQVVGINRQQRDKALSIIQTYLEHGRAP